MTHYLIIKTQGAFQKSELGPAGPSGQTGHLGNEIAFFQEVWLKNHLLCAYHLGFDRSELDD